MAFDKDALKLMPHTVTVESFSTRNNYGEASYASSKSFRARIQPQREMVRTTDGEEKMSTVTVILPPYTTSTVTYKIQPEDRITLADGSTSPILAVTHHEDESGFHHQTVRM